MSVTELLYAVRDSLEPLADQLRVLPQILPDPLSPVFQTGGPLDFVNEDVALVLLFMLLLGVLDATVVRWFVHPKARYFALHIAANTVSSIASFPDVKRAFIDDPLNAFSGASHSMVANSAATAIHLYHCIAFKLRSDDIFHHLAFVVALCGLAIPYKRTGGVANNLGCFFLCGLPGALNYLFLVLQYHGVITRRWEKKLTAWVNVWVRGPAMSVYCFLGFQAWLRGAYQVPLAALVLVVFLHFTNGQYYAAQAVESLTKYELRSNDGTAPTEGDVKRERVQNTKKD